MALSTARRAVAWSAVRDAARIGWGVEHLLLGADTADGALIAFDDADGAPYRLAYRVTWDAHWRTRTAELAVTRAHGARRLRLDADGAGAWRRDGTSAPELDGCIDLDIWPTPFTNTLPIRRLRLPVGERREIRVVYVAAPALALRVARQAYTRLDERRYGYEGVDTGFRAELPVDADGVVVDYPGVFRRLG
jgi:hypothetical protein